MNIYLVDGSPQCFYTAVFSAYADENCTVTSQKNIQLAFDSNVVEVRTDEEKAERVLKKLRRFDKHAEEELDLILRRGDARKEQIALEYLRRIVRLKAPARDRLSEPAVIAAMESVRKVRGEIHLMSGFLRFMEGNNGVFYAPFESDNDILELLVPHFTARLKNQPFIIHDTKRNLAALYNQKDCVLVRTDDEVSVELSDYEEAFQALWIQYYESVNIAERPHEKQMKGYMPVRYWKYMPEKTKKR